MNIKAKEFFVSIAMAVTVIITTFNVIAKENQPNKTKTSQHKTHSQEAFTLLRKMIEESTSSKPDIKNSKHSTEVDAARLKKEYDKKLANSDYVTWKSLPGLPDGYQNFPEERRIKEIRTRLARNNNLPQGITPIHIPVISYNHPNIDGKLLNREWNKAVKIPIGINDKKVTILLQSDGKFLYIGCNAISEKTKSGFDQCRFYYHLNLADLIINERIHIGKNRNGILGGIRSTTIRWKGSPSSHVDDRWKKYAISDWRIYKNARGLSSFNSHRQYEAKLDLKEIGISLDTPFSLFIEVESDPVYKENGKFDHRTYIGLLASQGNPQWAIIDSKKSTGHQPEPDSNKKVYRWIDKNNNIQFSDQPPPENQNK